MTIGKPTAHQVQRNRVRSRGEPEMVPQQDSPDKLSRLQTTVGNRGMQQLLGSMRALIGEGTPLPAALRAEHEQRFGVNLGNVRVHDHAGAYRLAHGQLARAFTLGSDIVFNKDFYCPGTLAGQRLIAHELAHVVQQSAGGMGSASGRAHEAAADAAAQAVVSGTSGPVHAGPAAVTGIQREPLSAHEIAKLNPEQLRARLQANEKEAKFMMYSEAHIQRLYRENLELKRQIQAEAKLQSLVAPSAAAPDPAVVKVMESINAELVELTPLVARLSIDVPLHPADHALNEVRNLDARVRGDEKAVREFEAVAGSMASEVHTAVIRFQVMQQMLAPAVAAAAAWHDANPAGESLGMMNERAGTWLAGAGLAQWDKGGLHYVPGALAFVGAFGVAFVDAGEKLASMGFHDAATAVSQAYTRGDISWNEGESILHKAAWRALLIAAVTRGAGMATSRLGVLGAEATGLASTTLRYGAAAGGIPGGLSAVAALSAQAVLTKGLEHEFNSPAGKAIWNQGMPQGKDWAIAIPLGIAMGGLGGMRGVELANDKLVGSIINTPEGPMKIVTVTKLKISIIDGKIGVSDPGVMVLQPVGSSLVTVPPPPLSDLVMTFDPLTNSWIYPKAPPTGLATMPAPKSAAPSGGGALVPASTAGITPAFGGAAPKALAGTSAQALTGALPKPALPTAAQPAPRLKLPAAAKASRALPAPQATQAPPKQLGAGKPPPLMLAPGLLPLKMLPSGPLPPLQLKPWFEDDFSDLGRELAQTPGSGFGTPTIWSVTPDGVVFATPPLRGVPIYAPPGTLLPPSSYFAGQPRSWTLSGPLQPNFTPFDVLPGQSATSRSLSQVRGARGPNARGAAGELHTAELSVGSRREVTLDLPADLARRSDVLSPTVAGTVNQEVKNYLRFRGSGGIAREVEWTPFMQTEIDRDAMIMYYYGQQPVWVFTDAPPSQALRLALDQAGIPYVVSTDRLPLP